MEEEPLESGDVEKIPLTDIGSSGPDAKPEEGQEEDTRSWKEKMRSWNWNHIIAASTLWVAYLLCNASYSVIGPFFPVEAEKKGASPVVVGIIIGCSPLSMVILSPLIGYMLPVTGIVIPVFIGLTLVGLSYVALGLTVLIDSTAGFIATCIILRLVEGVGTALFMTVTYSTLPQLFPERVSTMVALIEIATGFGYIIGPIIGGGLYKAGGYRLPFIVVGCLVLLFVIPCTILIKKIKLGGGEDDTGSLSGKTLVKILTDIPFLILIVATVTSLASSAYLNPTFEPFLVHTFNIDKEKIALMFIVGGITYMFFGLLIGHFVDKYGMQRVSTISGLLITASAYFLTGIFDFVPFIGRWYILVLCFALLLIGAGAAFTVVPIYSDMLTIAGGYMTEKDSMNSAASFIGGVISSSLFFGEFIGALVGGLLTNWLNYYESAFIYFEFVFAQWLLLLGVTLIFRYVRPKNKTSS